MHKKKKSKINKVDGIAATAAYNSWASIEYYAKHHRVYTAPELRELILKHSPIKKIGDRNLEIVKFIEDAQLKKKDLSFHAACLENFSELCILIAVNPYQVYMGVAWENLEKAKNKKFSRKNYPKDYTRVIEVIRSRYQRVVSENRAVYTQWYKQNKNNKETLNFIKATLKILSKQKK